MKKFRAKLVKESLTEFAHPSRPTSIGGLVNLLDKFSQKYQDLMSEMEDPDDLNYQVFEKVYGMIGRFGRVSPQIATEGINGLIDDGYGASSITPGEVQAAVSDLAHVAGSSEEEALAYLTEYVTYLLQEIAVM